MVYVWKQNLIIARADALASNKAKPSADTLLTMKLNMIFFSGFSGYRTF